MKGKRDGFLEAGKPLASFMDEVPPSTECPGLLSRFARDSWGPLGWGRLGLTESTSYPSSSPISLHPNHLQTGRSQKGLREKKEKEGSN